MKYIITILLAAAAFVYWRGANQIIKDQNLNCKWYVIYAVCEGKEPKLPGFMEVIKKGSKF